MTMYVVIQFEDLSQREWFVVLLKSPILHATGICLVVNDAGLRRVSKMRSHRHIVSHDKLLSTGKQVIRHQWSQLWLHLLMTRYRTRG